MRKLTLILPMAGEGLRFSTSGYNVPKPLIDINGLPMFVHAVKNIGLDFDRYIFIIRSEHKIFGIVEKIKQYFDNVEIVEVDYKTEGAAKTVMLAAHLLTPDESIFLSNCDQHVKWEPKNFNNLFKNDKIDAAIAVFDEHESSTKWSYVKLDNDKVIQTAEKKVISNLASVGYYYWKNAKTMIESFNSMFLANDKTNNEFYICPSFNYIKDNYYVTTFKVDAMYGIGTPEDLEKWKKQELLHTEAI